MPRILLTGSNGQLGRDLQPILTPLGELTAVGREDLDLANPAAIRQIIRELKPDLLINTAAYTAVDKAESEVEATAINGIAPGIMAEETAKLGATLIHFSTDYVFDGNKSSPYLETDTTNPIGAYGKSKLIGEQAIQQTSNANYLIIRTAWVYGIHGKVNFVKTMLRLGSEREEIRVVTDQVGSPTWTGDLARSIGEIIPKITPEITGIYQYTNSGVTSWYDFAVAIFEEAKELGIPLEIQRVIPITSAEYPTPTKRPSYSVLAWQKIAQIIGNYPPHWRQGLRQMLKSLNS
jgi:dTDP-4-dehydrorhamnose reductase